MSHAGMNLREALIEARAKGCTVRWLDQTGEVMIVHPAWPRRVRCNGRKKSAPRDLTLLLSRLSGIGS
jgi:hypothetical protein